MSNLLQILQYLVKINKHLFFMVAFVIFNMVTTPFYSVLKLFRK